MLETWVSSLGWEDPLREDMATHSSIAAWSILTDRGAWQTTVHGVAKSWTRLNTHSTVLSPACVTILFEAQSLKKNSYLSFFLQKFIYFD